MHQNAGTVMPNLSQIRLSICITVDVRTSIYTELVLLMYGTTVQYGSYVLVAAKVYVPYQGKSHRVVSGPKVKSSKQAKSIGQANR